MFNERDSAVIKMIMNLAHQILQRQLMNKGPLPTLTGIQSSNTSCVHVSYSYGASDF